MDKQKQQCVICHKDITNELPKIDIYGNHYCKDCYIEKCKYEVMNMGDTILINKELLKRELQYLEKQTQKYTRKETAEKFAERLKERKTMRLIPVGLDQPAKKVWFIKVTEEELDEILKEITGGVK